MAPSHVDEKPDHAAADDELQRLRVEANEKLLLAGIRAQEERDEARGAQRDAEKETNEGRAREQELQLTAEFRERLIGIVGHDLRNPLNAMVMASGMLIAHGRLTEDDARLASRILTSGQRMARMISQLVDFTRARLGGGFDLDPAPSDLGEICRDIAEETRLSASADIRLTVEGDLRGRWDADHLAEAISNIVGNAVDYATRGTPVLIHAHEKAGVPVVVITNHGIAIPPDELPQLFTAFRRGEAAASPSGHLGLGLYIASEIVRSHGGTLAVRSLEGTTSFTLQLPRA